MIAKQKHEKLVGAAERVRSRAYAPYSHYAVGAAVMGKSGRIYSGCNVENASYGLTVCAERAAIFNAVSGGETRLLALAVVTPDGWTPCGACRQVFLEFAQRDSPVIVADLQGKHQRVFTIGDLLPEGFGPEKMQAS